jgi:hypothetical protein
MISQFPANLETSHGPHTIDTLNWKRNKEEQAPAFLTRLVSTGPTGDEVEEDYSRTTGVSSRNSPPKVLGRRGTWNLLRAGFYLWRGGPGNENILLLGTDGSRLFVFVGILASD